MKRLRNYSNKINHDPAFCDEEIGVGRLRDKLDVNLWAPIEMGVWNGVAELILTQMLEKKRR